jgi:hypothetical protein
MKVTFFIQVPLKVFLLQEDNGLWHINFFESIHWEELKEYGLLSKVVSEKCITVNMAGS